ncbi:MAG: T9SS type A sorting domain-containing protein [Ignavibacteria bacterium]|nr:T9SS type A sorting domain-containing protein [Ignavibacteria bacterium]
MILKTANAGLVFTKNEGSLIADKYKINSVYPNPFNPVIKINYSIVKTADVSIKIFDIKGREITELVNSKQSNGNYEITLDGNSRNLSTGIYFVSLLINGSLMDSKKIILIK